METYIHRDGRQYGPYDESTISTMLNEGNIKASDLAWNEGMTEWLPLSELFQIEEIAPQVRPPKILPPIPQSMGNRSVDKPTVVSLWNPNTAVNMCFLFTPIFSSTIHCLNWKAMGINREALISLGWTVAFVVSLIVGIMVPDSSEQIVYAVGLGMLLAWYFTQAKRQVKFVQETYGSDYPRRSWTLPVGIGSAFVASVVGLIILIGPSLPEVDAPEVVALVEKAINESPGIKLTGGMVGEVKITNPGEVSYDKKKQKRIARAQLTTKLGTEIIFYSVQWHNKGKGIIWVQTQDHE